MSDLDTSQPDALPGLNPQDRDAIVRTILGEAGGEGPEGQAAVAHVIRNRLASGGFGANPQAVVYAPRQFEAWDNQRGPAWTAKGDSPEYQRTGQIVDSVWGGQTPDSTGGATHYYAPGLQHDLGRNDPSWSRTFPQTAAIGGHVFYRDPRFGGGTDQLASALTNQGPRRMDTDTDLPQDQSYSPLAKALSGLLGRNPAPAGAYPSPFQAQMGQELMQHAFAPTSAPGAGTTFGKLAMMLAGGRMMSDYDAQRRAYQGGLAQQLSQAGNDPNAVAAIALKSGDPELMKMAIQTYAQQPTWGKIGQDAFGNEQYGWINPRTQKVTPAGTTQAQQMGIGGQHAPSTQGASAGSNGGLGTPSEGDKRLHGDEYLKTLDPTFAEQVKRVSDGLDTINPKVESTPYGRMLKMAVVQYDPTFDSSDFSARAKARASFTSGADAKVINKLNTAYEHLLNLSNAGVKIDPNRFHSGDLGPLTGTANSLINSYEEGSQNPDLTDFKNISGKAAEELTQAYRGAGGAESDIKREIENVNTAQSPEQRNRAIKTMADLLQGKIHAYQLQYDQAMGKGSHPMTMITPKSEEIIKTIEDRAAPKQKEKEPAKAAAMPAAEIASAEPKRVSTKEEYDALPSKSVYIAPDGSKRVKP